MSESGDDSPVSGTASIPDFSHEALAHLQVQSDAFRLHVQAFLESGNAAKRTQLHDDLQRFRNTLVLLEKGAAVYVTEELIKLLDADAAGELTKQNELARVLVQATDQLSTHVALLQQDGNLDSALPLLQLVNDSRACRDESLMSEMVVLAAGIELPEARSANVADKDWQLHRVSWKNHTSIHHPAFALKLLRWWKAEDANSAQALSAELLAFETFSQKHDFLDVLVPLFQSAALVAEAVADDELIDGPALRSLFAQLERHVSRSALIASPEDLLPADLLRNFLYYVAQIESTSRVALELRRRFRLDRIRQVSNAHRNRDTPTIGVGYHLANSIRQSVSTETEALRSWLDQSQTSADHPKVVRLRVRLQQLEPVLTMMGATAALACLQAINGNLKKLDDDQSDDGETRQTLAELLLNLDVLLDENARLSITRSTTLADRSELSGEDVFIDMAMDACLREARISLKQFAQSLENILLAGPLPAGRCHKLTEQLHIIEHALQVLPLPEISPLLGGLNDLLMQIQLYGRGQSNSSSNLITSESSNGNSVAKEIATLLVSLDFYLGCVLQPQPAASQLLQDAFDALMRARQLLSEPAGREISPAAVNDDDYKAVSLLPHMDAIGAALASYRSAPDPVSVQQLRNALGAFKQQANRGDVTALTRLATVANTWFATLAVDTPQGLSTNELSLLDEVHALIPQIIDQSLGGSDDIRGFNELLAQLAQAEPFGESSDNSGMQMPDTGNFTLNVADELLIDHFDQSVSHSLDNTLQDVFYHECISHLEALDESVKLALQHDASNTYRLPTEQMLRALHTLTGSAQSVDAPYIVAIVLPLQRAALARQRLDRTFDMEETRYIGDLVMALRARLDSLVTDDPVGQSVKAVEQRLGRFLATAIPGSDEQESGLGIAPNVRSLDDVFVEEASEILDRLHGLTQTPDFAQSDANDALALLHTLKGSARMAGRIPIANNAHELESQVQQLDDTDAQRLALNSGYARLQALAMQVSSPKTLITDPAIAAKPAAAARSADSLIVSDTAFDTLLDLATDVTVNQARLSDELARLREVYQDIESTAIRWRELPQSMDVSGSSALNEMRADLEAARTEMRSALRQAEREQQQASRASSGLQQSLIRTRLVRVDELRERLGQCIEDASNAIGCSAKLILEGGEVTLDRSLFRQLTASLEHLARNAIVHGIETGNERLAAGKSASGQLTLSASVDGTDLVIRFSDDGRGIARESLNALLQSRGESTIDSQEALQSVLFKSGFSSIEKPNALAGHGLGLSAVQAAIEQMGGHVQLSTNPGQGTQIYLRLPQRIVVNQVVVVDSGGVLFAIPVNFIEAVQSTQTAQIPDRYKRLPLSRLLLQRLSGGAKANEQSRPTILVNVAGESLALEIDQIVGYREMVTQALGPQLATLKRFTGGNVLSDGRQVLILDLNRVVEGLKTDQQTSTAPARESLRPVALIVDDSLTMRVAAETILQQCGIATRSCRDGVEALESMAVALPNLIVLDIEMPRLDGRSFLKKINKLYGSTCPPVIVISSRDDSVNTEAMSSLGAVRFLTKPYTDTQLQEAVEAAGLRLPDLTIA